MKRKPCKQSRHSLRTNSRKSELRRLILVLTFVCPLSCIFPQEIQLDARQSGESVNISARFESIPYKEVFTSLQDGLEAEITFQFRLYEKVRGLFSIFGDRLIGQQRISPANHTADNSRRQSHTNVRHEDIHERESDPHGDIR